MSTGNSDASPEGRFLLRSRELADAVSPSCAVSRYEDGFEFAPSRFSQVYTQLVSDLLHVLFRPLLDGLHVGELVDGSFLADTFLHHGVLGERYQTVRRPELIMQSSGSNLYYMLVARCV